jgi:hypothetical protein
MGKGFLIASAIHQPGSTAHPIGRHISRMIPSVGYAGPSYPRVHMTKIHNKKKIKKIQKNRKEVKKKIRSV